MSAIPTDVFSGKLWGSKLNYASTLFYYIHIRFCTQLINVVKQMSITVMIPVVSLFDRQHETHSISLFAASGLRGRHPLRLGGGQAYDCSGV
jgi:hypothetical protein